jgi:MoaA/NifB/PqqE/SkfB family radical SAM enzyme
MNGFCGGCGESPAPECCDALGRLGVRRIHWECWSQCNLSCPFCFRSRSTPVRGVDAERVVRAICTSGAEWIVFAGGDPSLRRDIGALSRLAKGLGMMVEVQTNAQTITAALTDAIGIADSVGLSLDSGDPNVHDALRGAKGNYQRVVTLVESLGQTTKAVRVRSMVSAETIASLPILVSLLNRFNNVRWCLQEFTPVGDGFRSSHRFHLPHHRFIELAQWAVTAFAGRVEVVNDTDKSAAYAMVRSDGRLYGTAGRLQDFSYPTVGSLLADHLAELSRRLPFNESKHAMRYSPEGSSAADGYLNISTE